MVIYIIYYVKLNSKKHNAEGKNNEKIQVDIGTYVCSDDFDYQFNGMRPVWRTKGRAESHLIVYHSVRR